MIIIPNKIPEWKTIQFLHFLSVVRDGCAFVCRHGGIQDVHVRLNSEAKLDYLNEDRASGPVSVEFYYIGDSQAFKECIEEVMLDKNSYRGEYKISTAINQYMKKGAVFNAFFIPSFVRVLSPLTIHKLS